MYQMMQSQFSCSIETLWTFTANIRLHSFMSLKVFFEVLFAAEFLLTNVTREPSTFIVWLQQMCLELITPCKTVWTVSTWVRLCISVNTNMTLQLTVNLRQLPKDIHTVYCCCVHNVCVSASCWSHWNSCHTVNTCTVSLTCGLSCVGLDRQTY